MSSTPFSGASARAIELALKAKSAHASLLNQCHGRADRLFLWLMAGQWLFGIVLALTISPYAWEGKTRAVSNHVYAAFILGGLLSAMPCALTLLRPGWAITRHVIAFAQMMWGALLVHLTGGRIETHFHIFVSMAFLAYYRDSAVLITATITVALDHFVRGILLPESVYGIASASAWRFLEHAGWLLFEAAGLTLSIRLSLAELWRIAEGSAQMEALVESISPNRENPPMARQAVLAQG